MRSLCMRRRSSFLLLVARKPENAVSMDAKSSSGGAGEGGAFAAAFDSSNCVAAHPGRGKGGLTRPRLPKGNLTGERDGDDDDGYGGRLGERLELSPWQGKVPDADADTGADADADAGAAAAVPSRSRCNFSRCRIMSPSRGRGVRFRRVRLPLRLRWRWGVSDSEPES